ncbi:MAG TPA: hypothetical protein VE860_04710 [Chthoniobacterales bacterium]|nr:hypothetical protein [Chthoniobacterales bacterium]
MSVLNDPRYFGTISTTKRYCAPLFWNATTLAKIGLITGENRTQVRACIAHFEVLFVDEPFASF